MNVTKISFAVFMILSLATIAHGQITNPVLSHADPFITYEPVTRDGQYILTATGGAKGPGVTFWSGTTPPGSAATPHAIFTPPEGMTQIWSPTVWKIDGHWWVYFTAQMTGEKHKIYVLRSDAEDVLGTYAFKGALETGRQSIDPSLLIVSPSTVGQTIYGSGN
jgi:GH43 family beta-xylosidase